VFGSNKCKGKHNSCDGISVKQIRANKAPVKNVKTQPKSKAKKGKGKEKQML
jgi:hypothetical protein